ncbi:hypothetical protein P8C59_003900 [Phyllachora maydis]|uniref:Uncharacterized protein n=1 Tax=Phyllachora maydis TaxID=1825666 RepID=A0AAD9I2B3_9PEZI|nr:hypothetical protein P8C59_003900 [Phyllachora maydis]
MYIYIAFSPYRRYCCNSSFTNLLIANIDSLSNLDNLVYNIPGISTIPLAPAPTPAKPAKIMPARFKRTTSGDTGRYTTNSGLTADKDDNNIYNKAYMPPTNIEEEKGGSGNDNGVNSSTSDSTNKGKGSSARKHGKGASRCKDILLYKRQRVMSYPYSPPSTPYTNIYVYYV